MRKTTPSDADSQPAIRRYSGGFIGEEKGAKAFTFTAPANQTIPVVIAAPHGGRHYPEVVQANMREPEYCALRLEDRYVDVLASEVARITGAGLLVAHAPRAMLDLNRATDDVDWGMIAGKPAGKILHSQSNRRARSGLGLVPRRLGGFGEIWKRPIDQVELDGRIEGIHRPYHEALAKELAQIKDDWGAALLVDLHSMPPLRKQFGQEYAPQFVLGDRFGASCDASLIGRALRHFEYQGQVAAHNRPYAGGFVLDHHASPRRGIHAMQVEVCRTTYLDHNLKQPSVQLASLSQSLAGLIRELGAAAAQLSQGGAFPLAAE